MINQKNGLNKINNLITAIGLVVGFTLPKLAIDYIGPGAGLTLIGSLIGVIVAILMAVSVILFWPLRILIRRLRRTPTKNSTTQNDNAQLVSQVNSHDS